MHIIDLTGNDVGSQQGIATTIASLFDPEELYEKHFSAVKKWHDELADFAREIEEVGFLSSLNKIKDEITSICQKHGFDARENRESKNEDRLYTLCAYFGDDFIPLVDVDRDGMDLEEFAARFLTSEDSLDQVRSEKSVGTPYQWIRQAAFHLASQSLPEGIECQALDKSAMVFLEMMNKPISFSKDEFHIKKPHANFNVQARAGVRTLYAGGKDFSWTNGEIHLPATKITEAHLAAAVGRDASHICSIPGLDESNIKVTGIRKSQHHVCIDTDALASHNLTVILRRKKDDGRTGSQSTCRKAA